MHIRNAKLDFVVNILFISMVYTNILFVCNILDISRDTYRNHKFFFEHFCKIITHTMLIPLHQKTFKQANSEN